MKSPSANNHSKDLPESRLPRRFNGVGLLVAMVREADPVFRQKILAQIRSFSPIIARLAEHSAFIYRDIARLDDRGIQLVFSLVPETDWLIAWKLTDEKVRTFLLKNMSERRKKDFLASAENHPKVLKRRVYAVQAQIARKIHELLRQGKLGLLSRRPHL